MRSCYCKLHNYGKCLCVSLIIINFQETYMVRTSEDPRNARPLNKGYDSWKKRAKQTETDETSTSDENLHGDGEAREIWMRERKLKVVCMMPFPFPFRSEIVCKEKENREHMALKKSMKSFLRGENVEFCVSWYWHINKIRNFEIFFFVEIYLVCQPEYN